MVRTASNTVAGAVKVGPGLAIDPSGVLSVTNYSGYTLPKATATKLGGVIIGSGLSISSTGVLSVESQNIPVASENNFGIVRIGDGLTVTNGVLSNAVTQYELPAASDTTLGGIKLGYGLSVEDSVVSVNAKSFAVEGGQTIREDFDTGNASILYSVAPLTIDRNVTVTVGPNTTWVLYTPAIPKDPIPVSVPVEQDGGIFTQNYTMPDGKTSYSISNVTIDKGVTVTVGKTATWVVYTPGTPVNPLPESTASFAIQESVSLISSNYTITETTARSFNSVTIDKAVTVTVSALSTWIIF